MINEERKKVQLFFQDYANLKNQFIEFKENLQNYKNIAEFSCSIIEPKELSIGIVTPCDATILISFSTCLLEDSELRGKLMIEKLVEEKEKENVKIWEPYFDHRSNLFENLQDNKSYHKLTDQGYLQYFFTTLLTKFIEQCFKS